MGAGGAIYYFLFRSRPAPPELAPGPVPGIIELLPSDAPVFAYVDLVTLRGSPLSSQLSLFTPAPSADPEYAEFIRETGFDYERDLDRSAAAIWPGGTASSVLAIAEGRFDREKIIRYALRSGRVVSHGDFSVYEAPATVATQDGRGKIVKTISFVFLGSNRIALADGANLDSVIHPADASRGDRAMRSQIERVAGAAFFATAGAEALPKDLSAAGVQSGQLEKILRSIQFLSLAGRPEGDHLNVAADAQCDSITNALQLSTFLDGVRWLGRAALADPKNRRQLQPREAALLDSLLRLTEVTRDGKVVRLRVALTPGILGLPSNPVPQRSPSP